MTTRMMLWCSHMEMAGSRWRHWPRGWIVPGASEWVRRGTVRRALEAAGIEYRDPPTEMQCSRRCGNGYIGICSETLRAAA